MNIHVYVSENKLYKTVVELLSEYYPDGHFIKMATLSPSDLFYGIQVTEGATAIRIIDKKQSLDIERTFDKLFVEERSIKHILYSVLKEIYYPLPWGEVIAVRPSSLLRLKNKLSYEEKMAYMKDYFGVSHDRARLACDIALLDEIILQKWENHYAIYINIPFCPSRCSYCSFPTLVSKSTMSIREAYVNSLVDEIKASSKLFPEKKVGQIYIGGGTPAILSSDQFEKIFLAIHSHYNLSDDIECTVELGRPELINQEKLEILKKYGVNQININPQTLHDKTLISIGRNHTTDDFYKAYNLAKNYSFKINVDLIIGLPKESLDDYQCSLSSVLALNPDFITVHTLCEKNGAKESHFSKMTSRKRIEAMWSFTYQKLSFYGYNPYYLYRQKKMIAPFENVGFSNSSSRNDYNSLMMSSRYPVLGLGMGATSKLVFKDQTKTIVNYRNMKDYQENYMLTVKEKYDCIKRREDDISS